jgi:hypothetical protein
LFGDSVGDNTHTFENYTKYLSNNGKSLDYVVTQVSFNEDNDNQSVLFTPVKFINKAGGGLGLKERMSPEAAQALLLESGQTRWFRFLISGNTMHWRSAGARARVDIHGFRDCWDLMQDGVWRSPDTIIVQTSMRISQARDICDALEALGLLDSKVIFPKETVYAKIHGAIPAFYSPNFNIL